MRSEKVKKFSYHGLEVEFSELAFVPDTVGIPSITEEEAKEKVGEDLKKIDEELLFYSS
ncbi:MAG: hypothetical protein KAQ85_09725 [Thermodesulfovibrionia bacterium]|nr:hypothetical protein [Thermodesulfovibrionia bacterium]